MRAIRTVVLGVKCAPETGMKPGRGSVGEVNANRGTSLADRVRELEDVNANPVPTRRIDTATPVRRRALATLRSR
jgi:hypothetical protein